MGQSGNFGKVLRDGHDAMTSCAWLGTVVGDIAREILAGSEVCASKVGASPPEFAGNLFRMSVCNAVDFRFWVFLDLELLLDFGLLVGFDFTFDLTELTCICDSVLCSELLSAISFV